MKIVARKTVIRDIQANPYAYSRTETYILCLAVKPIDYHEVCEHIRMSEDDYVCLISDKNIATITAKLLKQGLLALA